MAEAPTLPDISRAPRTDAQPPKFIPQPLGEREPVPAPGPVQPRSGPATLSPQPRPLDISALPEAPRTDPKFVLNNSQPVQTEVVTRSVFGRLKDRIFGS